jgi:hypothetical protein
VSVNERRAAPGELCTCGRPARLVYITERWGEVGWCGVSDGGRRGRCVFCGDPAGHPAEQRCASYALRPPMGGPEPEAA